MTPSREPRVLNFAGNDALALLQAARGLSRVESPESRASATLTIARVIKNARGLNCNTLPSGAVIFLDCDGARAIKLEQSAAGLEMESLLV